MLQYVSLFTTVLELLRILHFAKKKLSIKPWSNLQFNNKISSSERLTLSKGRIKRTFYLYLNCGGAKMQIAKFSFYHISAPDHLIFKMLAPSPMV